MTGASHSGSSPGPAAKMSPDEPGRFVVPGETLLTVSLPDPPKDWRALERELAHRSPLPMREIAWTRPFREGEGGWRVAMVRKAYLDRETGALPYASQQRLEVRTPDGQRVLYTAPAARRRMHMTLAIVAVCAVVSLASLFAVRARPAAEPAQAAQGEPPYTALFARAGILASLEQASQGVPPEAALAAVAYRPGDPDPLIAEYAVADPDMLRAAMGGSARERGQSRLAQGGYAVSFALPAVTPARPSATAPVLIARGFEQARDRAERRLRALARNEVLQIAVTAANERAQSLSFGVRTVGPQANVLRFVAAIEGGSPAMRFADWRVERDAAGMALSGSIVVPVELRR